MDYNDDYDDFMNFYEGTLIGKDDFMNCPKDRVDVDVDSLPDSDTRENDLITLIDLKY